MDEAKSRGHKCTTVVGSWASSASRIWLISLSFTRPCKDGPLTISITHIHTPAA